MTAIFAAYAQAFLRDRPGVLMTLLLPPVIYLLFAAIFGASGRGAIDASIAFADLSRQPAASAVAAGAREDFEQLREVRTLADVEAAVLNGRADVGVVVRDSAASGAALEVISASGREPAAAAVTARLTALRRAVLRTPAPDTTVTPRRIGPQGDVQAAYYAGAVSVMFIFFAAMHGAIGGLEERRNGLQARLALAAGGLVRVIGARAAWLTAVGMVQAIAVFAFAAPRLPSVAPWQIIGALVTGLATAFAAAGLALLVAAACRSREQAQPLSTFLVLLLAALGGSMAPRFLMPAGFQALGWLTPHAWAIEAWQSVLWRARFDASVIAGWAVLIGIGAVGTLTAFFIERRRLTG